MFHPIYPKYYHLNMLFIQKLLIKYFQSFFFTLSFWTLVSILCTAHLIWDQPHFKSQQLHVATGYHIEQLRYRSKLNNPVIVGKYLVHLFIVFTWALQNKVLVQPHNFLALSNRFSGYNKRTSSFHSEKIVYIRLAQL